MKKKWKSREWIKIFDKVSFLRSKQKLFIRELIFNSLSMFCQCLRKKKVEKL